RFLGEFERPVLALGWGKTVVVAFNQDGLILQRMDLLVFRVGRFAAVADPVLLACRWLSATRRHGKGKLKRAGLFRAGPFNALAGSEVWRHGALQIVTNR